MNRGRIIIWFAFFTSCLTSEPEYANVKINAIDYKIFFYRPTRFDVASLDTLRYNKVRNKQLSYKNLHDTNIALIIQYPLEPKPLDAPECNLKCYLDGVMLDMSGMDSQESQYGFLYEHNGRSYARVHYYIYSIDYVCDEIFTIYKKNLVIARVASWNYLKQDTVLYCSLRDSFFNSLDFRD